MVIREGGFKFEQISDGWKVFKGRNFLGTIHTAYETSGRHCFFLGCDSRSEPRTYRGKVNAAKALLSIAQTKREVGKRAKPEMLIIVAWDFKPATV